MELLHSVLIVDAPSPTEGEDKASSLRDLIASRLDLTKWSVVHTTSLDQAQAEFPVFARNSIESVSSHALRIKAPLLVVLNVDVPRGWTFCTTVKKLFPNVPLIVVSARATKEVFNNHQKLDSRADAYHRIPDEQDGLKLSLSYFASEALSNRRREESIAAAKSRPRQISRPGVPVEVVQRLEAALAERTRGLEDARRKIQSLEAEREELAANSRRQMLELMELSPEAKSDANLQELMTLRERLALLETQAQTAAQRESELKTAKSSLEKLTRDLRDVQAAQANQVEVRKRLEADLQSERAKLAELRSAEDEKAVELAALRTEREQLLKNSEQQRQRLNTTLPEGDAAVEALRAEVRKEAEEAAEQLARASVQLSTLATELKTAHERRLQAEQERQLAETRVSELEQKLSEQAQSSTAEDSESLKQLREQLEASEAAWTGANVRAEQLQAQVLLKNQELERLALEKRTAEDALSTSRRLMREYATDAARKAEELKTHAGDQKALEQKLEAAQSELATLQSNAEFNASLVASLERDINALREAQSAGGDLSSKLAEREMTLSSTQAELKLAKQELSEKAERLADLSTQHRLLEAEIDALKSEHQRLQEELAQSKTQHATLSEQLNAQAAQLAALEQLKEELSQAKAAHEQATLAQEALITRFGEAKTYASHLEGALSTLRQTLEKTAVTLVQATEGLVANPPAPPLPPNWELPPR